MTLWFNILLLVGIVVAAAFTRSSAILAEAVHRAFDALNPVVLWFGYRQSRRPRDDRHPLGHSREAFTYSLGAAVLMLSCGAGVAAYRGVESLVTGYVPEMHWWAMIIMGVGVVGEVISLAYSLRAIPGGLKGVRESQNTTVLALVFENSVDIMGVLLALVGYGLFLWTGQPIWDALFSLAIACLLGYSSVFLIRRNFSLLTGEAASDETSKRIAAALDGALTVLKVEGVVAVMTGPESCRCAIAVSVDRAALERELFGDDAERGTCTAGAGCDTMNRALDRIGAERELLRKTLHEKVHEIDRIDIECA